MKEYIPFVKRKTEMTNKEPTPTTDGKPSSPIKNQFEEENVFLLPEEIQEKKKDKEEEGSVGSVEGEESGEENYYGEED